MEMKKTKGAVLLLSLVVMLGFASTAEARGSHNSHNRHGSNYGITIRLGGGNYRQSYRPNYRAYMPVTPCYVNNVAYQDRMYEDYLLEQRALAIRQRQIEEQLYAVRYVPTQFYGTYPPTRF